MDYQHGQPTTRPQSPTSPSPSTSPSRLSNLYQYHNAPEVAPGHGLEYDDTIYPSSDKCTVVSQRARRPQYDGRLGYDPASKPPRIIFGMKVRTFIIVAILFACILVGAAVGGAVGGKNMRGGVTANTIPLGEPSSTADPQTVVVASSSPSSSSSLTATAAAATPTYAPLSDCPESNNTLYSSTYSRNDSQSAIIGFTKYCDAASPLSNPGLSITNITEAYVYTFDDCIEICAGYNYYGSSSACTVAVYNASASRPADCWVGMVDLAAIGNLNATKDMAVALLDSR